jgi:hypothetical protein
MFKPNAGLPQCLNDQVWSFNTRINRVVFDWVGETETASYRICVGNDIYGNYIYVRLSTVTIELSMLFKAHAVFIHSHLELTVTRPNKRYESATNTKT